MICVGGYDDSLITHDYILSYNTTEGSWTHDGNMRKPRGYHAVSVVSFDEITNYCNL